MSIEKWTSAFHIFMSVMIEKYPGKAQELLKYARDIRLAASRSNTWFKYDEQFRIRKAVKPHSSLGDVNSEFWLLYVSSNSNSTQGNPTQNSNTRTSNYSDPPSKSPNKPCYTYNDGKLCPFFPRCRYSHSCSRCRGKHPQVKCRKQ